MPKQKISLEQAEVVPGAHLMDFGAAGIYRDGIIYVPMTPRGRPGAMDPGKPFAYKFRVDGPEIPREQLMAGYASSMIQRELAGFRVVM